MVREFHLTLRTSPLSAVAALSILALLAVGSWRVLSLAEVDAETSRNLAENAEAAMPLGAEVQQELTLLGLADSYDPSATSSEDTVSMIRPQVFAQLIGSYLGLQESGEYSDAAADAAATDIASNVKATLSYDTYAASDLKTDTDTTFQRMLTYRSDLREALEPLLENTTAEFEIYAHYVDTKDPHYLEELRTVAARYREAAHRAAAMTIPQDAVHYHVGILNAMQEFAATLEGLSTHADDPIASVALLRTYNDAEVSMYTSFNDLTEYYGLKMP